MVPDLNSRGLDSITINCNYTALIQLNASADDFADSLVNGRVSDLFSHSDYKSGYTKIV